MTTPPRVTILCQLVYPELVSTGQTITELAVELKKMGTEVSIYAAQPSIDPYRKKTKKHLHYQGVTIQRLWSTQFPKVNVLGRLINTVTFLVSSFIKLLFDKSNDPILVLTNPPFLGWVCAVIQAIKKRPFIYLIFDVYPETAISTGVLSPNSLVSKLWRALNRMTYERATHIIVIGRCMQRVIESYVSTPEKIIRTHVWADDKHIMETQADPTLFRKEWKLDQQFIILYSGNIGRFHDIETIIEAAERLKNHPNIHFLFVGEGHKKKWAISEVERRQLKNVSFKTYVSKKNLPHLLAMADVGLVSLLENQVGNSVPSKTFGLMAASVPILGILPQKSEIAHVINEEQCGTTSPPGNSKSLSHSILNLIKHPNELKEMGQKGQCAIQQTYNLNESARIINKVIMSVD